MSEAAAATPPATIANFAEIVAQRSAQVDAKAERAPRVERADTSEQTTDDGMKVTDLPRAKRPDPEQPEVTEPFEPDEEYEEPLDPTQPPEPAEPDEAAELAKLIASARKSGEPLKADVLAKLDGVTVAVPVLDAQGRPTGHERIVPLGDVIDGHMRQAKLTRELEKTYQSRTQAEHILGLERQRRQEWQNPQVLERDLRTMIRPETLHAWHMQWAEERYNYMKAPPEQRAMWDAMQTERQQRAQEQAELQQLRMWQQQQQQQQVDPATADAQRVIESNMDRSLAEAFKGANFKYVKVNDAVRNSWLNHLKYACDGGIVTPQACKRAAQAVVEELQDQGAATFERLRAEEATKPREVPPRRAPAGPPPARDPNGQFVQRGKARAGKTPADFRRKFLGD